MVEQVVERSTLQHAIANSMCGVAGFDQGLLHVGDGLTVAAARTALDQCLGDQPFVAVAFRLGQAAVGPLDGLGRAVRRAS